MNDLFQSIASFFRALKKRYYRSRARDETDIRKSRTNHLQYEIGRLESEIENLESVIEDNPYCLEALEAFSARDSPAHTPENRAATFQSLQRAHEHIRINFPHYSTSVSVELLETYFSHWQTFETLYRRLDPSSPEHER